MQTRLNGREDLAVTGDRAEAAADRPFASLANGRRLSDRVADQLLARILEADLQPGDKLPTEAELGRQFQVSRTVIREAVRSLAARGVVAVRPGAGISVARVDPSAASESLRLVVRGSSDLTYDRVHEVRRTLEVELARLAATRATDDDIREIQRIHDAQVASAHDIPRAARLDVRFHRMVAAMTRNELFVIMLDSLSDVMLQVRLQAMPLPGDLERGFVEHQAIIDAIGARDPAAARHEMAHHLEGALRAFHAYDRILRGVPAHGLRASAGEPADDEGGQGREPG